MKKEPEATVEEQVALMYLGTVDEAAAQVIADRVVANLSAEGDKPRNADVLYALVSLLAASMGRMQGTVPFRQTILRGFGDVAAGLFGLMQARSEEAAEERAETPSPEDPKPLEEFERVAPKPYTRKVTGDDDVYTVEEFRNACDDGLVHDDEGYASQACRLGADLHYCTEDKKYRVRPSDFAKREKPALLPGTTHIVFTERK